MKLSLSLIFTVSFFFFLFIQLPLSAHSFKVKTLKNISFETFEFQSISNVSGTVIDASGEGVPGVNVLEKGTTNGTED